MHMTLSALHLCLCLVFFSALRHCRHTHTNIHTLFGCVHPWTYGTVIIRTASSLWHSHAISRVDKNLYDRAEIANARALLHRRIRSKSPTIRRTDCFGRFFFFILYSNGWVLCFELTYKHSSFNGKKRTQPYDVVQIEFRYYKITM